MSRGNGVIVSSEPKGKYIEFTLSGTPKPGTIMQVKAATEPVNNKFTCEVYNAAADGNQRLLLVLLPDELVGTNATTAFVTGSTVTCYVPVAGEELNILVANIAGTGDAFAIGDVMMVDDGTGKLVATTGSPESEPFVVLATTAALAADALVHCVYTGY